MSEPVLVDETRHEAGRRFARLVDLVREEFVAPPTLAEVLYILSVSVPVDNDALDHISVPLRLRVKIRGNRRYSGSCGSRIGELNDVAFVEASDWLLFLAREIATAKGHRVLLAELVDGIRESIVESQISFGDVSASELSTLVAEVQRKVVAVRCGDVVAISRRGGRYSIAVVVARNRFGTALGFLRGSFPYPRVGDPQHCQVESRPVYTDDQLIANGTWPVIDHNENLLLLFPKDPEIYHAPDLTLPGVQVGRFGSAESSSGDMRHISKDEAEQVGLLGGTYRQIYVSRQLQQSLDD